MNPNRAFTIDCRDRYGSDAYYTNLNPHPVARTDLQLGAAMADPASLSRPRPSLAKRLLRERDGVTIVEFAFIAGPLFALIIAILQVSMTFFAQQNLETAAEKSSRVLMTGSAQNSKMSQADYQKLVCAKLPAFMKCANVMVDVQVANSFSGVDTGSPDLTYDGKGKVNNSWKYDTGKPGDIVIVKTMYMWDTQKGPLGFDLSTMSGGKRLLVSTSVFKSEPYAS